MSRIPSAVQEAVAGTRMRRVGVSFCWGCSEPAAWVEDTSAIFGTRSCGMNGAHCGCQSRFGIPFWLGLVKSPPILEPFFVVGLGCLLGPMAIWRGVRGRNDPSATSAGPTCLTRNFRFAPGNRKLFQLGLSQNKGTPPRLGWCPLVSLYNTSKDGAEPQKIHPQPQLSVAVSRGKQRKTTKNVRIPMVPDMRRFTGQCRCKDAPFCASRRNPCVRIRGCF